MLAYRRLYNIAVRESTPKTRSQWVYNELTPEIKKHVKTCAEMLSHAMYQNEFEIMDLYANVTIEDQPQHPNIPESHETIESPTIIEEVSVDDPPISTISDLETDKNGDYFTLKFEFPHDNEHLKFIAAVLQDLIQSLGKQYPNLGFESLENYTPPVIIKFRPIFSSEETKNGEFILLIHSISKILYENSISTNITTDLAGLFHGFYAEILEMARKMPNDDYTAMLILWLTKIEQLDFGVKNSLTTKINSILLHFH